jgi:hypothetical protein
VSAYSSGASTFNREHARSTAKEIADEASLDADTTRKLEDALAPKREDALAIIVKWVPGEVIGSYGAFIAGMLAVAKGDPTKRDGSEGEAFIFFLVLAFLLSLLGGYLAYRKTSPSGKMPGEERVEMFTRASLASLGLALWSFVIPGSYLNKSDLYTDWEGGAPSVIFIVAVVFGLVAEFLVLPATLRGSKGWSGRSRRCNHHLVLRR